MSAMCLLSALAMRGLASGACQAVGVDLGDGAADPVSRFLSDRFVNHGERLAHALQKANDRAWTALEYSLAGDSLWERCTALFGRVDDRAFREQVRALLDSLPPPPGATPELRRQALIELRIARKEGFLRVGHLDMRQLARQAGRFAAFTSPLALLQAEKEALEQIASSFPGDQFTHLRKFLALTPADGTPILSAAVRFFFRREVEEDRELFQGLAFVILEKQSDALEAGFRHLGELLAHHEQRLEQLASSVLLAATDTLKEVQQINQKLDQLLERHRLGNRELRLDDSLLTISDDERRLVHDLVTRYRALPEEQRTARVELAFKVGTAEAMAGDYAGAKKDFLTAATLALDQGQQAEAHASAFQAALSQHAFDAALTSLLEAARLDGERFAPFPLDKYRPERILGAGGFGVAFLCRHAFKRDAVVVKSLWMAGLDRSIDEVFNEAQVLSGLSHPAVIGVIDCDFADRARRARPFVVMEYFDGPTLSEHVEANGPLSPDAFLPLAIQVAEGLQAAHERNVFHRDVKPANILVRSGSRLAAKVIDFGLALHPTTVAATRAVTMPASRSLLGTSIAGTWKYAAPEQLGEAPGVPVGPHSDVFSFGRTCYFALLGTPEPDDDEKDALPESWKRFLSRSTARKIDRRPHSFAEVLEELHRLGGSQAEAQPFVLTPPLPKLDMPALTPLPPLRLAPFAQTTAASRPPRPPRPVRPNPPPVHPAGIRATTTATLTGHTGTVSVVAFSPDGRTLVTGSFDDRLRLWDLPDGSGGPWLTGHGGDVNAAAFSPDGALLATAGDDRTVRLWDLPGGRARPLVLTHPDRVYSVAFCPGGRWLASACDDFKVRLWSALRGTLNQTIAGHLGFVRHLAFSPDGKYLASASGDRTARLWKPDDCLQGHRPGQAHAVLQGHAHTVWSVAFSPDSRLLATTSQDRTARVWNVADGRLLLTLEGHGDIVWSAAFSPDGRYLATASHDKTVRVWSIPEGRHLTTLEGHTSLVRYVAFSPDGRYLATASGDNTARLWLLHDRDGCDWSAGEPLLPPRPRVSVTHAGHGIVYPGDELWLDVTVENAGRGDLVQLQFDVEWKQPALHRLGSLFGRVRPGEKVSRCVSLRLPADQLPGELTGELVFHEGNGYQPPRYPVAFTVRPFPRDDLPVTWRLADDGTGNSFGNGDGVPQPGECLDVVVTLENLTGEPLKGLSLSLLPVQVPAGVVINIPRADLPTLADGASTEGRVTFSVKPSATAGPVRMELRVEAADGRLFAVLPVQTVVG
jgi:WD40 repeat protein